MNKYPFSVLPEKTFLPPATSETIELCYADFELQQQPGQLYAGWLERFSATQGELSDYLQSGQFQNIALGAYATTENVERAQTRALTTYSMLDTEVRCSGIKALGSFISKGTPEVKKFDVVLLEQAIRRVGLAAFMADSWPQFATAQPCVAESIDAYIEQRPIEGWANTTVVRSTSLFVYAALERRLAGLAWLSTLDPSE